MSMIGLASRLGTVVLPMRWMPPRRPAPDRLPQPGSIPSHCRSAKAPPISSFSYDQGRQGCLADARHQHLSRDVGWARVGANPAIADARGDSRSRTRGIWAPCPSLRPVLWRFRVRLRRLGRMRSRTRLLVGHRHRDGAVSPHRRRNLQPRRKGASMGSGTGRFGRGPRSAATFSHPFGSGDANRLARPTGMESLPALPWIGGEA